jgi:phosphohistidine phosphatase
MASKKELFIVRHAKSSWDIENISDIDRPLKLKGIRNAYEMARRLKIDRHVPERYISSPANRALHTATIFLNVFELSYDILSIDERLYGHGVSDILTTVKEQDDNFRRMMIFGHNPDFSELARTFTRNTLYDLPTCGLAIFSFDCQKWSEISVESKTSEFFDFPKKES